MDILNTLDAVLSATMRMSTPLILGSIGALFSKRVGVMALGMEGMISMGAFMAVVGSYYTGNAYIGILCGMLGGLIFAHLHALLTVKYLVDHVLSGLGLNLLTKAFIPLMLQILWQTSTNSPVVGAVKPIVIPFFKDIPILGAIFYLQSPLTYLAWILVPISWVILFKTVFGSRLRIIGNNPYAASTAGVNVKMYKYIGVLMSGAFGGLAGAYLSISQLNLYLDGMSAERGYISVVINVLGSSNPIFVFPAALLFGLAESIQIILQNTQVPAYLLGMIPYIVTLIALIFAKNKAAGGAFVGKHFVEE